MLQVLEEYGGAVRLFLATQTQWVRAGMTGVPIGLNYAGVEAVMRIDGYTAQDFRHLQVMEQEMLRIFQERTR